MKSYNQFVALTLVTAALLSLTACEGRRDKKAESTETLCSGTFCVEEVKLEDLGAQGVLTHDSLGFPEKRKFQFQACVSSSGSRSAIALTKFKVSDGVREQESTTDARGCLRWDETHVAPSLQTERLLRIQRWIKGVQGYRGAVLLDLAFNPWESKLYDLTKVSPADVEKEVTRLEFHSEQNQATSAHQLPLEISAETFLSEISLEFLGHQKSATEINKLLTMKPVQQYRLRMDPQFVKMNSKNQLVTMDLRNGRFQVQLLVLRENRAASDLKSSDLVAMAQADVNVTAKGNVTKDIALRIQDTTAVLSRNEMIVLLTPLDSAARISKVGVFTGTMGALSAQGVNIKLKRFTAEADAFRLALQKISESLNQPVPNGIELLQSVAKLKKEQESEVAKSLLATQTSHLTTHQKMNRRSLLRSLCSRIYPADLKIRIRDGVFTREPKAWQACQADPEAFLQLQKLEFVETIHGSAVHIPELQVHERKIEISQSLSYSISSSTSYGGEFSVRGGVSTGGEASMQGGGSTGGEKTKPGGPSLSGALPSAKIGMGADFYFVASVKSATESETSARVTQSQSLNVVGDGYELDVTVRSCTMVTPTLLEVEGGTFACADKVERKKVRESYYLVNQSQGSSLFVDNDSATSTKFRLTIRGRESYAAFEKLMTAENTNLQLMKMFTAVPFADVLLPDFKVTQTFPGALSTP